MWIGKKKKAVYPEQPKRTYAFLGTHSGVGVTMISFHFALYLSRVCNEKTAYLELSGNRDMEKMEHYLKEEKGYSASGTRFTLGKLTVLKGVGQKEIPQILNEEFVFFVFDLGNVRPLVMNELLRCERKIVICNLVEWKRWEMEHFLERVRNIPGYKEWEYILNLCAGEENRLYHLDKGIKLKRMPVLGDCFTFTQDVWKLYHSFL